ncbi:MAG: hypothetical protein WBP83_11710, partial [Nitrososphaeraceae archaeon]
FPASKDAMQQKIPYLLSTEMTILFEVSIAERRLVIFCRSQSVQGLTSTFIFVTAMILMIIEPMGGCKSPSLVFQVGEVMVLCIKRGSSGD